MYAFQILFNSSIVGKIPKIRGRIDGLLVMIMDSDLNNPKLSQNEVQILMALEIQICCFYFCSQTLEFKGRKIVKVFFIINSSPGYRDSGPVLGAARPNWKHFYGDPL